MPDSIRESIPDLLNLKKCTVLHHPLEKDEWGSATIHSVPCIRIDKVFSIDTIQKYGTWITASVVSIESKPDKVMPYYHNSHVVMLVIKGAATFKDDSGNTQLSPGDVIVIPKLINYQISCKSGQALECISCEINDGGLDFQSRYPL